MEDCKTAIISQLPISFRSAFNRLSFDGLEEIRFRQGRPIMLYRGSGLFYLAKTGQVSIREPLGESLEKADIAALTEAFLHSSVYAHLHEMCDGFITLRGGHRVGLAGKCVLQEGRVTNMTDISGINLRIANSYKGCATDLDSRLHEGRMLHNVLLIAPPQCGKTTYLRDLARLASGRVKVTVVDERSELAAACDGVPQFDMGPQTDVLDRFPKPEGMIMAIRSLSPQLLVIDEIGTEKDVQAVRQVQDAGCKLLASVHGFNVDSVMVAKPHLLSCFEKAVVLERKNGVPAVLSVETLR